MTRRILGFCLRLAVTGAAITFLFSTQKLQFSQLRIVSNGWSWVLISGLLVLLQMFFIQIRLWLLLRASSINVGLYRVVGIGFISWFLNASLLGGLGFLSGDAIRAAYLMRQSDRRSAIVGAVLLDRIVGSIGLLTLASFSLLIGFRMDVHAGKLGMVPLLIYILLALAGVTIVLMIASQLFGRVAAAVTAIAFCVTAATLVNAYATVGAESWIGFLIVLTFAAAAPSLVSGSSITRVVEKWPWIGGAIVGVLTSIAAYRKKVGTLLVGYVISLASHALSVLALFTLAHGVNIYILPTLEQILFAAPIAFLTAILPLPANGLGVGEIAFDSMLRLLKSPSGGMLTGGAALYLSYRILFTLMALVGLPIFLRRGWAMKNVGES